MKAFKKGVQRLSIFKVPKKVDPAMIDSKEKAQKSRKKNLKLITEIQS